jgi:hypothetical protein
MRQAQPDTPLQQRRLAVAFHQLGMTAYLRGDLDQAEEWYRQALAITQDLGDRPYMALTFAQLGLLATQRGDTTQALRMAIRRIAKFPPPPDSASWPPWPTGWASAPSRPPGRTKPDSPCPPPSATTSPPALNPPRRRWQHFRPRR